MTAPSPADLGQLLHDAAARATLAPSIHNSQPWRFVLRGDQLELIADRDRSVPVVDPHGRQLAISCGAALFSARLALGAAGVAHRVAVLPDTARPDLLATVTTEGQVGAADATAVRLDATADRRHTNRRRFEPEPVPDDVIDLLRDAAISEGAWLQFATELDDRIALARLSQQADAMQNADPAYREELRKWTGGEPDRRDGVPAAAVPHVTGAAHDDIPVRDFDTTGAGALPSETASRLTQTLAVLGTAQDSTSDWLAAGQALQRVLLELTDRGFVAGLFSSVCEVAAVRQQLRSDLRLSGAPHLLLRMGKAEPTPASPRRAIADVVIAA